MPSKAHNNAVELRNLQAEIHARFAKDHAQDPIKMHPLYGLLEIGWDKVNVSTALRIEALRRAMVVMLPVLQSRTVEMDVEGTLQLTQEQAAVSLLMTDGAMRRKVEEVVLGISAAEPEPKQLVAPLDILEADFEPVADDARDSFLKERQQ